MLSSNHADDGDKKPDRRGEPGVSRKTIRAGNAGTAGVTVVTTLVCFFTLHARLRAQPALAHFPRPLLGGTMSCRTRTFRAAGRRTCVIARSESDEAIQRFSFWIASLTLAMTRDLQRREHRVADIGGAVLAAELHRLDPLRIDLVDGALDALAGFGRGLQAML